MPNPFPSREPARLRRLAWAIPGLAIALWHCGENPAETPRPPEADSTPVVPWSEIHGKIVGGESVWMLPGRSWIRHPERRAWLARSAGAFRIHVVEPPSQPLIFGLIAEPGEPPPKCLEARWNGADVTGRMRWVEDGEIQIPISGTELSRGDHEIEDHEIEDHEMVVASCSGEDGVDLVFRDLGFRRPPGGVVLDLDDLPRYRYLDDLLSRGVTGSLPVEKLSGMVFDGRRRAVVELPHGQGGRLGWTLHNSSHLEKIFEVHVGTVSQRRTLAPHARIRFEIPIPTGIDRVVLQTEGEDYGLGLWGTPTFEPPPTTPSLPSLVLITLDTTRRDLLATYGGAGLPHLDAFARRATVYEHARTTAPWTLPSHASVFTGLYPSRHGAGVVSDHLVPGIPTLAGRLRERGYLTLGVAAGPLAGYLFGLGQGFSVYVDPEGNERTGDEVVAVVEEQLERLLPEGGPAPPLFLFVNLFDPHYPYQHGESPHPHLSADWRRILAGDGVVWNRAIAGEVPLDTAGLSALRLAYRSDALAMDRAVGRLFELLRRHRLLDEALVAVTADHGELLGEGGYLSHSGRLDPELLEVPLLVRWPGQTRGSRVESLVSVADLYPTLLRIAGVEPRDGLDGVDLGPTGGSQRASRPWVLAEEHHTPFHPLTPKMLLGPSALAFEGLHHRRVRSGVGTDCFEGSTGAWSAVAPCPEPDPLTGDLGVRWESRTPGETAPILELSDGERARLEALGYL